MIIAIGVAIDQAINQAFIHLDKYPVSIPVFTIVIIADIINDIPVPMIKPVIILTSMIQLNLTGIYHIISFEDIDIVFIILKILL